MVEVPILGAYSHCSCYSGLQHRVWMNALCALNSSGFSDVSVVIVLSISRLLRKSFAPPIFLRPLKAGGESAYRTHFLEKTPMLLNEN